MWRVTATDREGREVARVELETGDLSIGRDADRNMVLPSPSVSRRHCRVRIDGNGPVVMDEGSANGVIVNGVRITAPTAVNQMSRIEVAEFRIAVEPGAARPMQMSGPDPSMMPPSQAMPLSGMPQQGMGQSQGQGQGMMASGGMMMPGQQMMAPQMMAPQMMPQQQQDLVRLIAEGGPYEGRVFDLPGQQDISVGRAVDNDLVLDDPSLSRKHSKLRRLGGGRLEVEDANSANGTYVNGRKVGRAQLGPGDTLRFGELMFRVDGGGLQPALARQASGGAIQTAPQSVKLAFYGMAAVTVLVYALLLTKVLGQPAVPQKGVVESEIAKRIHASDPLVANARQELEKHDFAKAKSFAQQALDLDPANLEAARLSNQALRGEDDDNKYSQANKELSRGSAEGIQAALRFFQGMSPESPSRSKLASPLSAKLVEAGMDQCRRKDFRACATSLCQAYQVAPTPDKPNAGVIKTMHDAEKRARMTAICVLR